VKILLTGSDGYIGSVVGPYLVRRGHSVIGVDTGFYRDGCFFEDAEIEIIPCIRKDLRAVTEADLIGMGVFLEFGQRL
jgi:nucleoside-diphosphate-sugar epimerase